MQWMFLYIKCMFFVIKDAFLFPICVHSTCFFRVSLPDGLTARHPSFIITKNCHILLYTQYKGCLLYTSNIKSCEMKIIQSVSSLTASEHIPKGIIPVSYTHLDVYKRQLFHRRSVNASISFSTAIRLGSPSKLGSGSPSH